MSDGPHDVGDPRWSVTDVIQELLLVGVGEPSAQRRDGPIVHMPLAEPAQRLDHCAADATGSGHLFGGGVLEDDLSSAELDLARATVREEHSPDRNLVRQAEHVRCMGAGCLDARTLSVFQGIGDVVRAGRKKTQPGVLARVVVQPAGKLANGASARAPAQGQVDGVARTQIEEVGRREHVAHPFPENSLKYL